MKLRQFSDMDAKVYHRKIIKLGFMHFPQSQNKNVNNVCIVGNPGRMVSEQGAVKSWPELNVCRVDRLFPYHVTSAFVRPTPPPPSFTWLVAYLIGVLSVV